MVYNNRIDYTNLNIAASNDDIIKLCDKAKEYNVKSVCVRPDKVSIAKKELDGTTILVCTVVSFPDGDNTKSQKFYEASTAIHNGADEIDMVLNYKLLLELWNENSIDLLYSGCLYDEITKLSSLCKMKFNKLNEKVTLKVIVESGLLSIEQTKLVTLLCIYGKADFIKTSTGMVSVGAELDKIKVMRETIDSNKSCLKIKASGGVNKNNIEIFSPYVQRFGMGFKAVDELNGLSSEKDKY